MSETILNWLNTQFDFTNKIINIENEFANGYNFGKLLHSNNLFDNMKELKNTNKKDDSLNNYKIIRKALDNIDVHLTNSDINELINKKKYKAELYLFKIKQKLSLKNCQFNEIMEKMNEESITNKKINFDLVLKNKRNQSAKPNLQSKTPDFTISNFYNQTNPNFTSKNSKFSDNKISNKINFTNYKARLNSAKLPNLNKTTNDRNMNNDNNKDDDQKLQEEKQIQSALDDIKIFENIHMNKNKIKIGINKKNPWDRHGYIYNTNSILNKYKNEGEKKGVTIFDLIDLENKKDNNINNNNTENKIAKLKSTLHNHNQFKVDNKKNYINKKHFEQGLSKMGLNANNMLPSIAKIKAKNIPSEIVMKSINETIKANNIPKQNLLDNNNINYSQSKAIYFPSSSEQKKILPKTESSRINKAKKNIIDQKRPFSSVVSCNKTKKNKKNKLNVEETKNNTKKIKRPLIAKESILKLKSKEINKSNIETLRINIQSNKKNKNYKKLSKIVEDDLKVEDSNQLNISDISEDKRIFSEEIFFDSLNKEKKEESLKKFQIKKSENFANKKIMKEIVLSIIDITEVYYDYQQANEEELVDVKKWNEVLDKFIYNKPIIKRKKKKKILTEEEIGNSDFDIYSPIDEEYAKNYGDYEISEMKNYINQIGNNYDRNKNNLFFKKMNLKEDNIEINDVMGEEIQILFDKAKAEGKDIRDEDDEEEFKRTGKIRYHPSREEEELLQPYKNNISEFNFSYLISDIIKFGYDKDPNQIFTSLEKFKSPVSDVIEEPKKEDSLDAKNSNEENIIQNEKEKEKEDNPKNIFNENNVLFNNINNENDYEENKLFIEKLNSIPIKISFVGILNNEIKITIKNAINKYPKMKIYNPIEFLNDLRQKKKRIDEPIDEQNLRKYQIDQLKKEKNNLTEEIKDYIDLIENKDNLLDDEICVKILQKKIKEDFETKNIENIRQEITKKRENLQNINNEINRIKEEQIKKQKSNLREMQINQQQLDKIDLDSMAGFIIINFPNNYEQSKLIEEKMLNFTQPCEKNQTLFEEINEKLLFLCDKEQKDHIFIKFNSFFEKIVYFYCDNSKIFPENPIPSQIGAGQYNNIQEPEFTEIQVEEYKNNFKKLEEFYQNFNIKIDKYDYYEGIIEDMNNPNNFNNNINMNSNNFIHREKIIIEKIKDALNIYEENIFPKNDTMVMEESAEEGLDVTQIKDKDSSRKVSGDSSLKQTVNNTSKQQIKPPKKDSNNSSSLKNNDVMKINQNNNNEKIIYQKQVIPNPNPNVIPKIINVVQISNEEKMNFYKIWSNFITQYNYYICRLIYRERTIKRKKPEDELRDIQIKFIKFLSDPKEQKIIINQFIQKYKIFKDKYCKSNEINSSSNITIINNYQKDLVELNETFWDIAKIRKNQAFEEIEKLEKENYVGNELNFCYFKMERLIILETQKLIIIINLFIRYYILTINPKILAAKNQITEFSLDILLSKEILKNVNKEKFAVQKDKIINYPRANRLYKNCFRVLIKIYIFLEKFFGSLTSKDKKNINYSNYKSIKLKKNKMKGAGVYNSNNYLSTNINNKMDFQSQIRNIIKTYINKYKYEMYNLYLNTLENLSKIYCPFKQVIKLMDSWIILSMELQNKKIKEILKIFDLTNSYKRETNIDCDKKLCEQIEKNIVDSIISEDNNIYNYEYNGISNDEFVLFNKNKFLGISDFDLRKNETDDDCLKLYDLFKELDILTKLKNNEIQRGIITKLKFEEIFFKYFLFENIEKMPIAFQNIEYHKISHFLSHFIIFSDEFKNNKDINNNENEGKPQELIYTNDIITILLLSCINFGINKINDNYKDNYISKEKFMKINFEFENEISKKSDKGNEFKSYLFNIHKTNNEIPEINIKQFLNLLTLKTIKNVPKNEIRKYFYLFDI